jgi:hypothetical protein
MMLVAVADLLAENGMATSLHPAAKLNIGETTLAPSGSAEQRQML